MPLPQNVNVLLGAGVFGIVCAATLYVVEHYRQDRRRHAMAKDLARLDSELSVLRRELDNLLAAQRQKGAKKARRARRTESFVASSVASEDYASAGDADSSDLEFYDVSDDEAAARNLDMDLNRIDLTLEDGTTTELDACLRQLQNMCLEFPENPQLLWRIGKAHYRLYQKTELQEHLAEGIEACSTALALKPELANVHKWLAILLGARTKHQPLREKIVDGLKLREHVEAGLRLNPLDPILHHMMGRFCYDMAELKWYERKVAAALVGDLPLCGYEDALTAFEEADKLDVWKENLLYIGKCKIKMGMVEEGVKVLEQADAITTENGADDEVDAQIKELLKQHR